MWASCGIGVAEGQGGVGLGKEFFGELVVTTEERAERSRDKTMLLIGGLIVKFQVWER